MYPIWFGTISILTAIYSFKFEGLLSAFFVWISFSALIMGIAYVLNKPYLVAGKVNGKMNGLIFLANLPWLSFTYLSFIIGNAISRERKIDPIGTTNVSIGCFPLRREMNDFDVIFDLTCEFPKIYKTTGKYYCFPNLDGMPLINSIESGMIRKSDKVLIHCAQGHGRSSIFASRLLCFLGYFDSLSLAQKEIRKSRPKAIPSSSQRIENQKEFLILKEKTGDL